MAGATTFAPVRATAEVASQRGARIQGLLFREVMPPREAPTPVVHEARWFWLAWIGCVATIALKLPGASL